MYTSLKLYRLNIVIYYSYKGVNCRINTGVKVADLKQVEQVKQSLKKNELPKFLSSYYDLVIQSQNEVEAIVKDFLIHKDRKPHVSEVKDRLKRNTTTTSDRLIDFYNEFLIEKTKQFNEGTFSSISIKDYKSFLNSLKDFETENETVLYYDQIDKDFIYSYFNFLRTPRKSTKRKKYHTRGNLKGRTIRKRFDTLKTFYHWLQFEKKKVNNYEEVKYLLNKEFNLNKGITKKVNNYALNKTDLKEIHNLYNYKLGISEERAIDSFLFCCYTGVRYSDLININKDMLKKYKDKYILDSNTHKTHKQFKVVMNDFSLSILNKYDYDLNLMNNARLNLKLKSAIKKNPYFDQISEDFNKPLNQLISVHTGRRTFVSRLLNEFNVPPSRVMKMTGHTQISTLNKYIHPDNHIFDTNNLL